jgi:hypothetical protein
VQRYDIVAPHRGSLTQINCRTEERHSHEFMKSFAQRFGVIAAGLLGMVLALTPAAAQQVKAVAGVVVNFGLVPAELALHADGHRDAHPEHPRAGSQHVLVTLDDEKTGKRIGNAEVLVEVTDPQGRVDKKPLLHTQAGGLPDYSELFVFRWSGEYRIHAIITLRPGAKPIDSAVHSPPHDLNVGPFRLA